MRVEVRWGPKCSQLRNRHDWTAEGSRLYVFLGLPEYYRDFCAFYIAVRVFPY
jgi:hypothetical protein